MIEHREGNDHPIEVVFADLAALARRCAGMPRAPALLCFLEDSARYYFELMEKRYGSRHLVMHDPLAIAAAIDPALIVTQTVAVDVEIAGELTSGMTLADWRGVWKRTPNAEVATEVDPELATVTLLGAVFYRRLMTDTAFDPADATELVSLVLG